VLKDSLEAKACELNIRKPQLAYCMIHSIQLLTGIAERSTGMQKRTKWHTRRDRTRESTDGEFVYGDTI